ncbi:MAG: class I adenylate-forming enzyme family protein [bacterium]
MSQYEPIHHLLENSADRTPDRTVLVHGESRVTFGEVETAANRLANLLRHRGVTGGDRVALLADNSLDYVVGFFGILKAGGCVVALNSANKARTRNQLLRDSGTVGLVTRLAQTRRDLPEVVAGCEALRCVVLDRVNPRWELPPDLEVVTNEQLTGLDGDRPNLEVPVGQPATILYTSGSTGLPRGATLTHRNLAANTRQILAYLRLTPDDSVMVVLPFHYSFGNSLLLTHIAVGARLVIDNRFAYPHVVLDTMEQEQVTGFSGVPSTYAFLTAKSDFLQREFPALRYLTQAGGAMSPALTRLLREALPSRIELFVMYGQTEASARLSYLPPARLLEKLGSIGVAIPGVTLTVQRDDGGECDVDEVGEIVAAGDNIMAGYWNDPEETARVLRGGRLFTGDLARRDSDGYLFVVDRIKNIIKCGAHRVSAKEIEETIAELPGVMEVCVVGLPDELLGEAIEAFVVRADLSTDSGTMLNEQAVLLHCRDNLAMFKIPRAVTFLDQLPKSSSGKIVKAELIKQH